MRARWLGPTRFSSDGNAWLVLALAAGGAALMNTWLSIVHASLPGRLVTTLPWLSLTLVAMLRLQRTRREATAPLPVDDDRGNIMSGIGGSAVLLAAGGVAGLLVVAGSAVLLGVLAIGYGFAPWRRIRLCRRRPIRASLSLCGGGALALAVYRHDVEFMFLPIAAWILGMSGLVALLAMSWKTLPATQPEQTDTVPVEP